MSTPVTSARFMTPVELDGHLTPEQERAASLYVAEQAHDVDDARTLLQALGLIPSERDRLGVRSAYGVVQKGEGR